MTRAPSGDPPARDDYSRSARCGTCQLTPVLCVCSDLPVITLPVRFIVIRHRTEIGRHSNTGALVPRLLPNSVILEHGLKEGPFDPAPLEDRELCYSILFPDRRATVLGPESIERSERPLALIVLDGSWRKARRMALRIPSLRSIPYVELPAGDPSPRVLRKTPARSRFFTLDAVVRAVHALGYPREAGELRRVTELIIRRRLHGRGKLPRASVVDERTGWSTEERDQLS